MSYPTLSVVIPVYNYGHLVERAVHSILDQEARSVETILVDDGSKDNSAEVCGRLATQNNRIHFLSQENRGAAAARNRGIKEAGGEYLVFLDADDEFCDGALEKIMAIIVEKTPDVIIGAHYAKEPDGKLRKHLPGVLPASMPDRIKAYLIDKKIRISNGAIVIRRSVFERGLFPEQFRSGEDIPVFAQALCSRRVIFTNDPLVIVNKHATSLRHQAAHAINGGMDLVNEVFDKQRLPIEAHRWMNAYASRRALSLMRTLYKGGYYREAVMLFRVAVEKDSFALMRLGYLRRALAAFIKINFRRSGRP